MVDYTDTVMGQWHANYDSVNRLTSTSVVGGPYDGMSLVWAIDAFGNRKTQMPAGHIPPQIPLGLTFNNGQNRADQLAYDTAGNVTNDGSNRYLYDSENRICAVSSPGGITGYLYDASGQRVAKGTLNSLSCDPAQNGFAVTETYLLGQGGEQLVALNKSGTWTRANVFAGGTLLGSYDAGRDGFHYVWADWLGTKRVQTSAIGVVEENCTSLPYCDSQTPGEGTGVDATNLSYTGKEYDLESNNDYFGARYYNSGMGRFMSPDLSGGHLEDPQTLNKYVYVHDNPLSLTDPTGLDFYLQCASSTQNPATCQQVTVGHDKNHNPQTAWVQGITNADKSFTATQIGNDANGGLIDKTTGTGAYTASVGPSGVLFSQDGSTASSMGVFVNHDANPTSIATSIQGTGALSGFNFTFTNSKLEADQTAAGTFTFSGTPDQAGLALEQAGFASRPGMNYAQNEYRSPGRLFSGANASHFNVDKINIQPWLTVPQAQGDMHFGEHNPFSMGGWAIHPFEASK